MKKQIERSIKIRFISAAVLFAVTLLLLVSSRFIDGMSDWYAVTVYSLWVNMIGRSAGIFPFSVTELLLYLGIVFFTAAVLRYFRQRRAGRITWKRALLTGTSYLLPAVSLLVFLYMANCGILYYRTTFAEQTGLVQEEYTPGQLALLAEELTLMVNRLAGQVERDQTGVSLAGDRTADTAVAAMRMLGETYPALSGYYPRPKGILVSDILSYQKLTGIYSPFTIEANYNRDVTAYVIPHTMCHELAHLKGFMNEGEANYIAYLACIYSEDVSFQYSGTLTAWSYTMNALFRADYGSYARIYDSLDERARTDIQTNSRYWRQYDGAIADAANRWNDTYLKANAQSEGVASYGQMVNLLMAQYLQAEE